MPAEPGKTPYYYPMVSRKAPDDDGARNEQCLMAGARSFGLELSAHQVAAFGHYLSLLSFWNNRLNLTAIREPELVVRLHFLDSLSVVPLLSPDGGLLDIGSGAGLPGIPIKIALPDKPVYLVEPRRKRANFLRHVIRELKLADIHVIESRAGELSTGTLPPMKETVTRGFSDGPGFLEASGEALAPDGVAILMHGPKGTAALDDLRSALLRCGLAEGESVHFELPFGGERRTVLTFTRGLSK